MEISYGAAVLIQAAYKKGIIDFEVYCEIQKQCGILLTAPPEQMDTMKFISNSQIS